LAYGSDIVMALDHVVGLPAAREEVLAATQRSERWLKRCLTAFSEQGGHGAGRALFGICQGGMAADLRTESAQMVAAAPVDGCAIGGLSVGESKVEMDEMLCVVAPHLPPEKPRYLMGVGSPEDLWNAVDRGVDLFDCVLPTRLARNAALFTADGRINIRARRYATVHEPIEPDCDCATCARFTTAYLHHLYRSDEVLGLRLGSVHNLRFLARCVEAMRTSIESGTFRSARSAFLDRYRPVGATVSV
jgi:queuine tRNA-ribosyltransferase